MLKYLLNALKLSKKSTYLYLKEDLYKSLYLYYKNKNDVNNAFEFLEKLYELSIEKKELRSGIDKINIQFNYNNEQQNGFYLNEHIKNNIFEWNRDIYLENMKGDVVKVNIDSIISVISTNKFIKIYFPNKQASIFKKSLKDFTDLLYEKFQNNHLLFSTNLRKEIVNLYWLSAFDKSSKKIYLNVLENEFIYSITRTQLPKLKEFLTKK
jgi:DNA-binding LytR/AlgR family response regulator